jgi:hypothetical protein
MLKTPLESGIELPLGLAQRREYEDKKMKENTFAKKRKEKRDHRHSNA